MGGRGKKNSKRKLVLYCQPGNRNIIGCKLNSSANSKNTEEKKGEERSHSLTCITRTLLRCSKGKYGIGWDVCMYYL